MPNRPRSYVHLGALALLAACEDPSVPPQSSPMRTLEIMASGTLQEIPSASGIESWGDGFLVIGDDSPWLFALDGELNITGRHALHNDTTRSVMPKERKPDLEAMTLVATPPGEERLLIFGSGSRSPQRDILLILNPLNTGWMVKHDLGPFYQRLRMAGSLGPDELNLEGAVAADDQLWLLNRVPSLVFRLSVQELLDHLQHGAPPPDPRVVSCWLPSLGGRNSGFTGATLHPNGKTILFSAAVEDTPNAYDDGEVAGSFIGALDPGASSDCNILWCLPLLDRKGHPLPVKVESLVVLPNQSGQPLELLLVTDSDGGPSEWFRVRLVEE